MPECKQQCHMIEAVTKKKDLGKTKKKTGSQGLNFSEAIGGGVYEKTIRQKK
jgi:hypothetical protein